MEAALTIKLTSEIVSAHVSNNNVSVEELPELIEAVFRSLAKAGTPALDSEKQPEPAVSIRSSVRPEAITCLECGARMKMLKRHLAASHGLTPAEYRSRWNLSADYPLVAPKYSKFRRALAKDLSLGERRQTGKSPR